jgi:hypothetical protein
MKKLLFLLLALFLIYCKKEDEKVCISGIILGNDNCLKASIVEVIDKKIGDTINIATNVDNIVKYTKYTNAILIQGYFKQGDTIYFSYRNYIKDQDLNLFLNDTLSPCTHLISLPMYVLTNYSQNKCE